MIFAAIADWADMNAYAVGFMCAQLGVSRSGYYKWRKQPISAHQAADSQLSALIVDISARCNRPGVRRMRAELRALGYPIGPVRCWRLMRNAGVLGRAPRRHKTTIRGSKPVNVPDLIARDFHADRANEKWCGDITYVKTWNGWAYLATVIDLHSRKLVGWAIADNMETTLVIDALEMALKTRRPPAGVIFHSDRGCQYTSGSFAAFCKKNKIRRSLGRTGICFDNAVAESFNATYKKELVHTRPWPTIQTLKTATFEWVESQYNRNRRHSTLNYLTIEEYELGYRDIDELPAQGVKLAA